MTKKPLYPHVPKKVEPLFPHTPKGQQSADLFAVRFWDDTTKSAKDRDDAVKIVKEGLADWMQKGDSIHWVRLGEDDRVEPRFALVVNELGEDTDASAVILFRGKSEDVGLELLAKTEGDPVSKYCCRQCGECVPEELLEEGRFPDRMSWLRQHYRTNHPGKWGTGSMLPATIPVSPEYRRLLGWFDEPLPPDAF